MLNHVMKLGTDHYFLLGGLPFLGLADNFFLKSNAFQTIFFNTFCNENNFLRPFLKTLQAFYRSYLKNTSCACKHMEVSSE